MSATEWTAPEDGTYAVSYGFRIEMDPAASPRGDPPDIGAAGLIVRSDREACRPLVGTSVYIGKEYRTKPVDLGGASIAILKSGEVVELQVLGDYRRIEGGLGARRIDDPTRCPHCGQKVQK